MTLDQARYVLKQHNICVHKQDVDTYNVKQIGYDDEIMTEGQVIDLALGFGEVDSSYSEY